MSEASEQTSQALAPSLLGVYGFLILSFSISFLIFLIWLYFCLAYRCASHKRCCDSTMLIFEEEEVVRPIELEA